MFNIKREAKKCFDENKFLEAIEKISEAITKCPLNSKFFALRCEYYTNMSQWRKALSDAERSIFIDDTNYEPSKRSPKPYLQCAIAIKNIKNLTAAVKFLKNGILKNNNNENFSFVLLPFINEYELQIVQEQEKNKNIRKRVFVVLLFVIFIILSIKQLFI